MQQIPTGYFIHSSVYVSLLLSHFAPPSLSPTVSISLFSISAFVSQSISQAPLLSPPSVSFLMAKGLNLPERKKKKVGDLRQLWLTILPHTESSKTFLEILLHGLHMVTFPLPEIPASCFSSLSKLATQPPWMTTLTTCISNFHVYTTYLPPCASPHHIFTEA